MSSFSGRNSIGTRNNHPGADQHFRFFASALESEIAKLGELEEDETSLMRQKRQVEKLVDLEKQFRKALIQHPWGASIYKDFVTFICEGKRNILSGRPYFRERQGVFTNEIIPAFKARADRRLYRYHANFNFISFAMQSRDFTSAEPSKRSNGKLLKLFGEIKALRNELAVMNMPLAISRARIFYSWTPISHLTYMDFVQIATDGLMAAIDKYCLPFSRVFRSVIIGRIVGNFIEEYNQTLVHFWPKYKRLIYQANKIRSRQVGPTDVDAIADAINSNPDNTVRTTPSEVAELLAASSTISADTKAGNGEDGDGLSIIDKVGADDCTRPDVMFEAAEVHQVLHVALEQLPCIERKLIRLQGVAV